MGTRTSRGLHLALALCLGLLLAGCATKFAYNHLDWALNWKVKRLVSLEGEQKDQTQAAIRSFHSWHRQTQLPQYAAFLSDIKQRLEKGKITAADVQTQTEKAQALLDQSVQQVLPDAVAVLSQLDQKTVDELLLSITEEREEYIEEHVDLTDKKQVEKRYEKFEDHAKTWLGSLHKAQKRDLEIWAANLDTYEPLMAKQQLAWQQQLDELLAKRDDKAALSRGLRELVFHRTDNWDKKLAQVMNKNQAYTYEVVANLVNNMSDKQRQHLYKKIDDYVQIFTELHNDGK